MIFVVKITSIMIDYTKLNNFYLFKQFILLFKFQGFVSTYIPTYIIK